MTPQQKTIIAAANIRGGRITKQEVCNLIGAAYFCNAENHVGAILSRMVNAGLLIRERPGVFKIGSGKKAKAAIEDNEPTLFEL